MRVSRTAKLAGVLLLQNGFFLLATFRAAESGWGYCGGDTTGGVFDAERRRVSSGQIRFQSLGNIS
jgi:hypothetical protein